MTIEEFRRHERDEAHALLREARAFLECLELDDEDDRRDFADLMASIERALPQALAPRKPLVMATYSGALVEPFDIAVEQILTHDVAHHLALLNRYCGATRVPYNVAEHSVKMSYLAQQRADGITVADGPTTCARWALFHDATEAYLGDVHRSVKRRPEMAWYRYEEELLRLKIAERFGLPEKMPDLVDKLDRDICGTEMTLLCRTPAQNVDRSKIAAPMPGLVLGEWGWQEAETRFLARVVELWGYLP